MFPCVPLGAKKCPQDRCGQKSTLGMLDDGRILKTVCFGLMTPWSARHRPADNADAACLQLTCCRLASRKASCRRRRCRCRRPMRRESRFPMRACPDTPTSRPKTCAPSRNSILPKCAPRTCGRPSRHAARCFPRNPSYRWTTNPMCLMMNPMWCRRFRHCRHWGKPMRRRRMGLPCLLRLKCSARTQGKRPDLRRELPRAACEADCGFLAWCSPGEGRERRVCNSCASLVMRGAIPPNASAVRELVANAL